MPGVAVAVAIIVTIAAFAVPMNTARQLDGRIIALATWQGSKGSSPRAQIDLGMRSPVWVSLPRSSVCRIGERVAVVETTVWVGSQYALVPTACLPVRAPGRAGSLD
ncbi:hypothetical protein [Glacieibacterium frigidum]|uniref:Uncharacterized protein n=1 Tax=Glacieibacterium frigidum TaxID=2593303 RepID=A0A552UG05_9SPHN|nr:hypothetical protein [Glacieibacterium frigidum]TRW17134.1 hypothetical protein FMM06_02735 [Glacieibacterium frigidum]